MKQRMFCTAVAVMIVLRAAVMLPINIVFTGCCMLCVAAVLLAVFCKKHINIKDYVFVLLACSVALCAYEVNFKINVEPAMQLSGVRAEIVGTVVEEPKQKDGYKVFLVKTESIDKKGAVQKVKLRICANAQEDIKPFDKISASVDFSDVSENYKSSNYANGIYIGSTADDFMRVSSPDKPPVYAKIIELRQYVRNTLKTNIGDRYSGVICGLILGDIDGISDNDYLNFREIGVMHLFSVSGLHLIVVCSVFMAFLRKIRIGKRFSALITLGVVFLVMSITGFSPSVMRSSITYIIMLLGIIFMRLPGNINSLGVAILVILIIKPYYILNLAFIMSCVSIMGIIFLSSPINSFFMRFAPDIAIVRG
ncbi:MAG: ComEC/Rec2 family competence protein, partial [Oscillospiraceae bacterium]